MNLNSVFKGHILAFENPENYSEEGYIYWDLEKPQTLYWYIFESDVRDIFVPSGKTYKVQIG